MITTLRITCLIWSNLCRAGLSWQLRVCGQHPEQAPADWQCCAPASCLCAREEAEGSRWQQVSGSWCGCACTMREASLPWLMKPNAEVVFRNREGQSSLSCHVWSLNCSNYASSSWFISLMDSLSVYARKCWLLIGTLIQGSGYIKNFWENLMYCGCLALIQLYTSTIVFISVL